MKRVQAGGLIAARPEGASTAYDQTTKALSAGTYDQGFEKGLRVGERRAIAAVLFALGRTVSEGY